MVLSSAFMNINFKFNIFRTDSTLLVARNKLRKRQNWYLMPIKSASMTIDYCMVLSNAFMNINTKFNLFRTDWNMLVARTNLRKRQNWCHDKTSNDYHLHPIIKYNRHGSDALHQTHTSLFTCHLSLYSYLIERHFRVLWVQLP